MNSNNSSNYMSLVIAYINVHIKLNTKVNKLTKYTQSLSLRKLYIYVIHYNCTPLPLLAL